MAKRTSPNISKIKVGFWTGIGIAIAGVVVAAGLAILRPRLPFDIPA